MLIRVTDLQFCFTVPQVVSQVPSATGEVVLLPNLLGVQGVAFDKPTVVLAQTLGGMEDIPDGVVALLTRSSTDVLSHVAIRARTQGVLLAGCSDEEEWKHLVELVVGCQPGGHGSDLYILVSCCLCSIYVASQMASRLLLNGSHRLHDGNGPYCWPMAC